MYVFCHKNIIKCQRLFSILSKTDEAFVPQDIFSTRLYFNKPFYPTALNGCWGIVFTHGVRMVGRAGGQAAGNSLSGLYLRNHKV